MKVWLKRSLLLGLMIPLLMGVAPPARTNKDRLLQTSAGRCSQGHEILFSYYDSNDDPTDAERIEWKLMDGTLFALQLFGREDKQLIFIRQFDGDFKAYNDVEKANMEGDPCTVSAAILERRKTF